MTKDQQMEANNTSMFLDNQDNEKKTQIVRL